MNIAKKRERSKRLAGFTLIELLIVIGVFVILVAVVAVAVNDLQVQARDSRRVADMKAIRNALALYQTQFSTYPSVPDLTVITGSDPLSNELKNGRMIEKISLDPINSMVGSIPYFYQYQSLLDDSTYVLRFCLETDSLRGYTKGCDNAMGP